MKLSRSEETKKNILDAAASLFSQRGYNAVTMREIAKEAGCSHTSVHVYFTDKETLLHTLALPPLERLEAELSALLDSKELPQEDKLFEWSLRFVTFSLENRSMIGIIFEADPERVDEEKPKHRLTEVRNRLFRQLRTALTRCLKIGLTEEQQLEGARIYFFALYGVVNSYRYSNEDKDQLLQRLAPTFRNTFRAVLFGLKEIY
ncbi:TetR/AcrR family transcriptional regulator [Paenibacillus beijingensis]|uniref:HTH tetR-type domain-containing protein n=1 Tax=Paenibacillus beijingensis TaxID=1126833 RepID=A0A0D5NJ58_9BACL|nr:TetR/AcrR family transcriptional regulator [Paenibacillus beijingensis]AJY75032.1 hypothetical protein VN24_11140 [Paenibacillus beijingensis]